MDSEVKPKVKLYMERAGNEFRLGKALFKLSEKETIKAELGTNPNDTFYSAAISHCYYAIFYSAKAILLSKNIKTKPPEEHKKTIDEFKKNFVDTGILDVELLRIYNSMLIRASELLHLFAYEKWKRGYFTYHTIAQANIEPARESIENSRKFLINIKKVIEKR